HRLETYRLESRGSRTRQFVVRFPSVSPRVRWPTASGPKAAPDCPSHPTCDETPPQRGRGFFASRGARPSPPGLMAGTVGGPRTWCALGRVRVIGPPG